MGEATRTSKQAQGGGPQGLRGSCCLPTSMPPVGPLLEIPPGSAHTGVPVLTPVGTAACVWGTRLGRCGCPQHQGLIGGGMRESCVRVHHVRHPCTALFPHTEDQHKLPEPARCQGPPDGQRAGLSRSFSFGARPPPSRRTHHRVLARRGRIVMRAYVQFAGRRQIAVCFSAAHTHLRLALGVS